MYILFMACLMLPTVISCKMCINVYKLSDKEEPPQKISIWLSNIEVRFFQIYIGWESELWTINQLAIVCGCKCAFVWNTCITTVMRHVKKKILKDITTPIHPTPPPLTSLTCKNLRAVLSRQRTKNTTLKICQSFRRSVALFFFTIQCQIIFWMKWEKLSNVFMSNSRLTGV